MERLNITDVIGNIHKVVENHKLAPGSYKRFPTDTMPNPYGCADAANILYSIGAFPKDEHERSESVRILKEMQDAETGMFHEVAQYPELNPCYTHHDIHTTAHCMAAIELFDAEPLYHAKALERYLDKTEFEAFMESIAWRENPWSESHKPAGLYVALNLGGSDTLEFNKMYFEWMWENADPDTGLWRKGCQDGTKPLWDHMAGTFHYLFNHEHAHMPLRYPDKLIDSCISMYRDTPVRILDKMAGFIQVDWVYCLTRSMQQTPHRFPEAMECLEDFAVRYIEWYKSADFENDRSINDLHALFGSVCALAELQRALRGKLYSEIPLKLVLDRRPFI